ncbi:hypothetical protein M404DRAFT_439289 [Pisolithus tinctorius Marx 270]|uniref:Uncharacterized protein n=1 Tax=Pisolithus tinctorius Marx 270 TaxID=870435 RepID=A0A0C3P0T3_PISTI|nr:hypothetical protein M404DRAFT_439289 [Pisolithus tinctorius Marx 270]
MIKLCHQLIVYHHGTSARIKLESFCTLTVNVTLGLHEFICNNIMYTLAGSLTTCGSLDPSHCVVLFVHPGVYILVLSVCAYPRSVAVVIV